MALPVWPFRFLKGADLQYQNLLWHNLTKTQTKFQKKWTKC